MEHAVFETEISQEVQSKINATSSLFSNEATITVKDQAGYDYAVDLLKQVKRIMKEVGTERTRLTKPLNDQKTEIIALFKPFEEECTAFERTTKASMQKYLDAQEAKRRAEQAVIDERDRKKRERFESRAQTAMDKGQTEKADDLLDKALDVGSAPVAEIDKGKGISTRGTWVAEITNKDEFLAAAIGNPVLMACIEINQSQLNKLAVMMKDQFNVAGAKASKKNTIGIRA